MTGTESLIFPFAEIDNMKRDFEFTARKFFKIMMHQTQKLLYFYEKAMNNKELCGGLKLQRSASSKMHAAKMRREPKSLEDENKQAVDTHMKNIMTNINFSDFSSCKFSGSETEYSSDEPEEIVRSKTQKEKGDENPCEFHEFSDGQHSDDDAKSEKPRRGSQTMKFGVETGSKRNHKLSPDIINSLV